MIYFFLICPSRYCWCWCRQIGCNLKVSPWLWKTTPKNSSDSFRAKWRLMASRIKVQYSMLTVWNCYNEYSSEVAVYATIMSYDPIPSKIKRSTNRNGVRGSTWPSIGTTQRLMSKTRLSRTLRFPTLQKS